MFRISGDENFAPKAPTLPHSQPTHHFHQSPSAPPSYVCVSGGSGTTWQHVMGNKRLPSSAFHIEEASWAAGISPFAGCLSCWHLTSLAGNAVLERNCVSPRTVDLHKKVTLMSHVNLTSALSQSISPYLRTLFHNKVALGPALSLCPTFNGERPFLELSKVF